MHPEWIAAVCDKLLNGITGKAVVAVVCVFVAWKVTKSVLRKRKLNSAIVGRRAERNASIENLRKSLSDSGTPVVQRRVAIASLTFGQLVGDLQNGKISAKEALEAYQWKAIEANDATNCVCVFFPEATEWAEELDKKYSGKEKPPLFGVPVSIKESIKVKGLDSTRGYAQQLFQPSSEDSAIVASLRRLGAVPFVHTNVPQSLLWYGCSNPIYGTTKNPVDPNRTSGGSSGGEAALLALGGSIVGIGGDVGGSIRIPAHFCGVVGLKPSYSRLSQVGSLPSVAGRPLLSATLGVMGRDVDGVVALMRHLTSDEKTSEYDPYLKPLPWREEIYKGDGKKTLTIGYYDYDGLLEATPACRKAVDDARKILVQKGHKLVPFRPQNTQKLFQLFIAAGFSDGADYLYRMAANDIIDPLYAPVTRLYAMPGLVRRVLGYMLGPFSPIMATLLSSPPVSLAELRSIYEQIEIVRIDYLETWKSYSFDALICPAFPCVSLPHDVPIQLSAATCYTSVFNVLDFVTGVVPITKVTAEDELAMANGGYGEKERFSKLIFKYCSKGTVGLPVGVQCVTVPNQEELCMRLMKEIESGLTK